MMKIISIGKIGPTNYKNKTLLFKISGTKTGINGDMAFDNFKVDEAPPCGDPYSLAVLNCSSLLFAAAFAAAAALHLSSLCR